MTDFPAVSILCIDDEPFFLDSFKQILEREQDFSVQTCSTGSDAIEFLNSYYFDVIISDYAIPDIDGITLLKEVRSRGFPGLFIIITGKHRAHIAIDALNNGANYYFQKGGEAVQDIPQLIKYIRNGVAKERVGSPLRSMTRNTVRLLRITRIFSAGSTRMVQSLLLMMHTGILWEFRRIPALGAISFLLFHRMN